MDKEKIFKEVHHLKYDDDEKWTTFRLAVKNNKIYVRPEPFAEIVHIDDFQFKNKKSMASFSIKEDQYLLELFGAITNLSFHKYKKHWGISKRISNESHSGYSLRRYPSFTLLTKTLFDSMAGVIAVYENFEEIQKKLVGDLRCLTF